MIDEVVCGLGRTGTWFGYQHYDIQPDIVTMAKGVASGYAAISLTVTTEEVFEQFKDASDHMGYFRDISTFGGCTAGPAAALENMRIIEEENLLENCKARGAQLIANLEALAEKHSIIGDVRGKGLFCGAELVDEPRNPRTSTGSKGAGGGQRLHGAGCHHRRNKPLLARFQQHALPVTGSDLYGGRYRSHHRCHRSGPDPRIRLILREPDEKGRARPAFFMRHRMCPGAPQPLGLAL